METLPVELLARLQKLGLGTNDLPLDRMISATTALCLFPMYMVANVHGWTGERQFKVPYLDFEGLESWQEAFAIGDTERRLSLERPHRDTLTELLTVRKSDRALYDYALETIHQFLEVASPEVQEEVRFTIASTIVRVAKASREGFLASGPLVSMDERACIGYIDSVLSLKSSVNAANVLMTL